MELKILFHIAVLIHSARTVHYPPDPRSEISSDDKNIVTENVTQEQSNESDHEENTMVTEADDKRFLDEALEIVTNPFSVVKSNHDLVGNFKADLEKIYDENSTIELFFDHMDKLALDICKSSQKSLWSYVVDTNNELAKDNMMTVSAEEDEFKIEYWNILKTKYLSGIQVTTTSKFYRKMRMIKIRGTNLRMLRSKEPNEIDTMHHLWSHATVCSDDYIVCTKETVRTLNDIVKVFKTSNDTKELEYYWKAYRDATGKKIRPVFESYMTRTNDIARSENFNDAGDMWRYYFEDDNFINTVDKIWSEIKPLYKSLHNYVRAKLKTFYKDEFKDDQLIPAHLLGNLWAQEWQAIFPKVALFPSVNRASISSTSVDSKVLFDCVDDYHKSLGFDSSIDTYQDVVDTSSDCLPSSHDLCDGVTYKIKWCEEKVSDVIEGLSKVGRLMSHIQYFKHYRKLELVYRDGPNPAFHNAISDFFTLQITAPKHLKKLDFVNVETGFEGTMNHLLMLALEKLPVMAYSYILDKWRWDIFAKSSLQNWNQHWWDLRINEMGLSPPLFRNEKDLDPASKYHVVSHVQYITYLISHVLEFQILLSLCKRVNHTGPLHECSIYGNKEAGKLLSNGMSLGASEDWRTVLETITGETDLSTEGILSYFSPLSDVLKEETAKLEMNMGNAEVVDKNAPMITGIVVVILIFLMLVLYFFKKKDARNKMFSVCALRQKASLDIVTYKANHGAGCINEVASITEGKV